MSLSEAHVQEMDVEGLLDYAAGHLDRASSLWAMSPTVDDRVRLQRALFPNGLAWNPEGFRTAVT